MLPHFYSLNEYTKNIWGEKAYKLALNGGMSCPNRDGLIDTRGCIFCSSGGSGEFAGGGDLEKPEISGDGSNCAQTEISVDESILDCNHLPGITAQIEAAKVLVAPKYKGHSYIAYFQAFTNTYAPIAYLRRIFTEAINHPDIVCLSIATRPDCLDANVIALLVELNAIKPVWIELGLQTIHERTAAYIRRGYSLDTFETCVKRLHIAGIATIVHVILGLPNETADDMYATASYLSHQNIQGIKLQLLHVLRGTDLANEYAQGLFETLSLADYIDILAHMIELLPKEMVIHRITGDGPKSLLIAPLWSANKRNVLNCINREFATRHVVQGRLFR